MGNFYSYFMAASEDVVGDYSSQAIWSQDGLSPASSEGKEPIDTDRSMGTGSATTPISPHMLRLIEGYEQRNGLTFGRLSE